MDTGRTKQLDTLRSQAHTLHENLDAIGAVLEGTYGMAKEETLLTEDTKPVALENALDLLGEQMDKAIERLQTLRERLQAITRRL